MYVPASNPKAAVIEPTAEQETRAYCSEISRRLLEYEINPRNFLKRMRQSSGLQATTVVV